VTLLFLSMATSVKIATIPLRVPDAPPVRRMHVGDDMALVQRLDVNVCDDLSDLWKVGRREDQVTQDLQRIGLGVCGDTELGLSRASLTGFDPDPVPMQIAIHAPILPQRCSTARGPG
jgi:hypothetical protein